MHRFAAYWLICLSAFVLLTETSCRKKKNPPPTDNQVPLNQILPGKWSTDSHSARALVTLSGVEYEIIRQVKSGTISMIVRPDADRLHFEGQGIFETTILVQGQNLQTTDQMFGYSDQNAAYEIISFEKDRFEMARASGGSTATRITVNVERANDAKITLSFKDLENIENLGMVEFTYTYTLDKTE
ncbi:MAG: hypothetical protein ACK4KT_07280 [Thermaurantimonas sp.]